MRNQKGMSVLKLSLSIALGILIAGFIGGIISLILTGTLAIGFMKAMDKSFNNSTKIKPTINRQINYINQPTIKPNSSKPIYQEDKYDRIVREQFEKDNPNFKKQQNQIAKIEWTNKQKAKQLEKESELTRDDLIKYRQRQIAGQH